MDYGRMAACWLEPMAGIEPATDGLRNRCSTAELHWLCQSERAAAYQTKVSGGISRIKLQVAHPSGVEPETF